jgi:hypothetical protein
MIKPGLACQHQQADNLPDFGPGLALRSRSARLLPLLRPRQTALACSYRQGLLHREMQMQDLIVWLS